MPWRILVGYSISDFSSRRDPAARGSKVRAALNI